MQVMEPPTIILPKTKRYFGWIGTVLLLLIILVKGLRWTEYSPTVSTVIGIAPSVLGPSGLLFLILSSSSPRVARLTLLQLTVLVGAIAVGLEFLQLIPRPGSLAIVHYTFDWLDVFASVLGVVAAYVIAHLLIYQKL